jgi:hypothetical protein
MSSPVTWRSRLRQAASHASLVGGSFLKIRPIQRPPVRRNFEKRRVELDESILNRSVLIVAGVAGRIRWEGVALIAAAETEITPTSVGIAPRP